jgi:cardiolipin synthase
MTWVNPSNLLTVARLLMAAPVIWAILERRFTLALALLFLAGLSDALDGPLARRRQEVTRLGARLDPIADKVLLSGSYLALWAADVVPGWLVALVFGRDLLILAGVGCLMAFTPLRDFAPSLWGKVSTVVQVVAGVTFLTAAACPWPALGHLASVVIWAVAAATLWSGIHYACQAVERLRRAGPAG